MKEITVKIVNKLGMHARSAAAFSKLANNYSSSIEVSNGNIQVNGKSIMELLTIAAAKGTEIKLRVHGPDENNAIEVLADLVRNGFGEEI